MTDIDCADGDQSVLCNDDINGDELLEKFSVEEEEESLSDYEYYDSDDYKHGMTYMLFVCFSERSKYFHEMAKPQLKIKSLVFKSEI